jgi:hypothetical protein
VLSKDIIGGVLRSQVSLTEIVIDAEFITRRVSDDKHSAGRAIVDPHRSSFP